MASLKMIARLGLFLASVAISLAITLPGTVWAGQLLPTTQIPLGVSIVQIHDDPGRSAVYAIDRVHSRILFINPEALSVTKSIYVGEDPTGLDIDEGGNVLYVANSGDGSGTPGTYRISLVDLNTQSVVTNFIIPEIYVNFSLLHAVNVTAGRQGRLYYNAGYDLWNGGMARAMDADTGDDLGEVAGIKSVMLATFEGSRLYGQYVYYGNLGQMGVWDISSDDITQTGSYGYSPYSDDYGWRYTNYSISDDERYVAYGQTLFASTNLSCQYGVLPEL
ncbi:MAG: hypothetical protein WCS01_01405, partial [bacterium]